MNVYTLSHCTDHEGTELLGVYQYLGQAQEAEYAWKLQAKTDMPYLYADCSAWTEIREVTLGTAPATDAGKIVED
jgi:hypothetical protein